VRDRAPAVRDERDREPATRVVWAADDARVGIVSQATPSPGASRGPADDAPARAPWEVVAPYARSHRGRSALDVATSVVPYVALSALMYLALDVSYLLTLAIAIPTCGFLVRTHVVFHDCAHGSFLRSPRANAWLGTALGLLLFSNFLSWRDHAVHHATAGDLDRRGVGDVATKTVAEYQAPERRPRLAYRLYRTPLVMFGLGPIFSMIVQPRLVSRAARPRIRRSVIATNLALVALVGGLCALMGWREYLLVQVPTAMLAGAAGSWLLSVQHQFEDVYADPELRPAASA
jgi:omega-6 fatty acid desaturase (delta-12 desaturase)